MLLDLYATAVVADPEVRGRGGVEGGRDQKRVTVREYGQTPATVVGGGGAGVAQGALTYAFKLAYCSPRMPTPAAHYLSSNTCPSVPPLTSHCCCPPSLRIRPFTT
jgi:hypothetical protein